MHNATWDPVEVEMTRRGNTIIYEWSYALNEALRPGRSIGFDYEVIDKDPGEEGFPSVMTWSPGAGKSFNTGNVGDLVLVPEISKLYTLNRQIAIPFGQAYGHGNNGDFRCQFEILDGQKMGFALFTNGSNGHKLVQALREFLFVGRHSF